MENENATITNKHRKKKIVLPLTALTIGGEGGIAGLLVFGGALAIAGFMAVTSLSNNKKKAKGTTIHHQPKPEELLLDDDELKSEDSHITTQSHIQLSNVTCCWTSNKSINQVSSSELLSVQPLILEKIDLKSNRAEDSPTCVHQEIAFSDYSHPESATSSNENGAAEECLESLVEKDELTSAETETETDSETEEEEDEDDDDSDDVTDIEEEETGTTSMDYNEEPAWPAKLIREPLIKREYCDDDHSRDADYNAMRVAKGTSLKEKANLCMVLNDHRRPTWVVPMLLIALLLLLVLVLLNRRAQPGAEAVV